MQPAKLFLVDDHNLVRDGLRLLLGKHPEFEVCGEAFDTEAAWAGIEKTKPDLVVLDLELPGSGLVLLHRLHGSHPEIKVLVLTGHAESHFVQDALRAGAHGYVVKSAGTGELLAALRAVVADQIYLCPAAATHVVSEFRKATPVNETVAQLTPRELEVLKEIASGQSTKEIAFALGVSAKTVETHRLRLLSKLNVRSVAELTKFAVREGLTTP